jgi:hypothetical protein
LKLERLPAQSHLYDLGRASSAKLVETRGARAPTGPA